MAISLPEFSSDLFEVRQTTNAGRAVFAKQHIPKDTHLHTCASPAICVIYREYRREVCVECFAYYRGEHWKFRDTNRSGVAWCSPNCKDAWFRRWHMPFNGNRGAGSLAFDAWAAVESLVCKANAWNNGDWDIAMLDVAGEKPSEREVQRAWKEGEIRGATIRKAREAENRWNRRMKQSILAQPPAPDILTYLLSAFLTSFYNPEEWSQVLKLAAAPRPYNSLSQLKQHVVAFHQLLAILPMELLDHLTAEVCLAASNRDTHNSFGLRSLDDDGSEMFGYGVWPSASFWNHSCSPNVKKRRIGRAWKFETSEEIEAGEELCITYLGGYEKTCELAERRDKLQDPWEFKCMCTKCTREDIG